MIQASSLNLAFNNKIIFNNLSFIINQKDKIGLVGRNGSGKTTLLKAIIDHSVLDSGTVTIQSRKKVAYMPQEVVLESQVSVLEETLTTFVELIKIQDQIKKIEIDLENDLNEALLSKYTKLHDKLNELNPDYLAAKAKKILMGLGFSEEQLYDPVSKFSVGWKMRIVLAKLLLQEADFYFFDEPTNHLDITAKDWFLDFLKEADFGFILICHERYFLDELCTKILELELGKATWYNGNYSKYIVQKEHNMEILKSSYVQQQKDIKRKQAVIDKFRSGQRSRMAQSMEKALEKIDRVEIPPAPKTMSFNFPPIKESGKEVISVHNLSHKFDDKTIFKNVSFEVKRGQKISIVAPNGVGKTTLFNLIAGILPLQNGTVKFGYNVKYALFAQDQNKILDKNLSIIDNLNNLCPSATEQSIRNFLGAFLFSGEDAFKKVSVLSGGEKNRVGMISILLQNANLLLLDEPTNHLDIPSKEVLLHALQEYKGTILFVSHDKDFINDLATDIIELTASGVHLYQGNYDDYLHDRNFSVRKL